MPSCQKSASTGRVRAGSVVGAARGFVIFNIVGVMAYRYFALIMSEKEKIEFFFPLKPLEKTNITRIGVD